MKRKLVDIGEINHKRIEAIREIIRMHKGFAPTVPQIVYEAVEKGLPIVRERLLPNLDIENAPTRKPIPAKRGSSRS